MDKLWNSSVFLHIFSFENSMRIHILKSCATAATARCVRTRNFDIPRTVRDRKRRNFSVCWCWCRVVTTCGLTTFVSVLTQYLPVLLLVSSSIAERLMLVAGGCVMVFHVYCAAIFSSFSFFIISCVEYHLLFEMNFEDCRACMDHFSKNINFYDLS